MPTQEDRVLNRVKILQAYIRDSPNHRVNREQLFAWCLTNMGVRDRTVAQYLNALLIMGVIRSDIKKNEVEWISLKEEKI
jgi:hypothetical protein